MFNLMNAAAAAAAAGDAASNPNGSDRQLVDVDDVALPLLSLITAMTAFLIYITMFPVPNLGTALEHKRTFKRAVAADEKVTRRQRRRHAALGATRMIRHLQMPTEPQTQSDEV
jgi:hypothetical protein